MHFDRGQGRLGLGSFPIVKDINGMMLAGGVVELGVECPDGVQRRD